MPTDWDKLRIFHAVAEAGSLTHAGEALHLSQSAVSRQIRALEENLGATLFHRHARGLILTEQGELLYSAARDMATRLNLATARIGDAKDSDGGELRISTTHGLGSLWLAPRLSRFFSDYPDISIDLVLTEQILDLPMREADVALMLREPEQAELIRRPLAEATIRFYAAPEYVERHGAPASAADFRDHRLISYRADRKSPLPPAVTDWLEHTAEIKHKSHLSVNNYFAVMQAAETGIGIAPLPDYLSQLNPRLIPVGGSLVSPAFTIYIAYADELRRSRRVLAFRDFILEELASFRAGQ
ncbi:LysR family transcriptional regulator [Pikeienuella sp. HZG-20]|uniref:LysR family transcriptional regulator n=1 Tax=Paludibacillus litoralis TaxID=3133267 RepID=UPI0030EE07A1